MQDFKKLKVWEKAHQLTLKVYRETKTLPQEERYGLTSQIRRASSSIPANIAEGCGRSGGKELRRFLDISMGSASELECHLLLAHDLQMLQTECYQSLDTTVIEIKRMLTSFIQKLRTEN